jgi:tetratricopeptide (TPR) repeat protein
VKGEAGDGRRGCVMCSGLYLRFNGQLPCWDNVGESHVLRTVTREGLESGREKDLFAFPELLHIRSSFAAGVLPYPEDCTRCAMLGHLDDDTSLQQTEIRVLHVEPSYYCHLSCPLCIPAADRRRLMPGPQALDPALFEAFLRRLKADGVSRVKYMFFEGRGDALVNTRLGRMIRAAKAEFPGVLTNVVTHGSYPFKPWIVTSGLDVLTLSVDGARPDSYARYRVGGDLDVVLALMRRACEERQRARSHLRVVWRYILFEWNDSDEELREASRLAASFGAELRFMRTHSKGRSQRFPDAVSLATTLRRLGIDGVGQSTFEIKTAEGVASTVDNVEAEHVAGLLGAAWAAYREGDERYTIELLREALARDPGVAPDGDSGTASELIRACLPEILRGARSPSTVSGLATLCREWGDEAGSAQLLERYVALAPAAGDRDAIVAEHHLRRAIAAIDGGSGERAAAELREALQLDPGLPIPPTGLSLAGLIDRYLEEVLAHECAPSTLCGLAHLCDHYLHDRPSARKLYSAYLQRAGHAPNRADVEAEHVAGLLGDARASYREGHERYTIELLREAIALDPGVAPDGDSATARELIQACLPEILRGARAPSTVSGLATLCREWGDAAGSARLLERYVALAPAASDREAIVAEQHLRRAIAAIDGGSRERAAAELREALRLDPGLPIPQTGFSLAELFDRYLEEVLARECAPSTLCGLAHLCDRYLHDRPSARRLYSAYLQRAGHAPNRADVEVRLRRLERGWSMRDVAGATLRRLAMPFRIRRESPAPTEEGTTG